MVEQILNTSISISNAKGLNILIKTQKLSDRAERQDPRTWCLQGTYIRYKATHSGLKAKGWEKIENKNTNYRIAGMITLTSDKVDFKTMTVTDISQW